MGAVSTVSADTLEADLGFLTDFADKNRERYEAATPFPHIAIDNFLLPEILDAVVRDFPGRDGNPWEAMVDKDQKKFAANVVSQMAPSVRRVLYFLNSREIVNFLEKLTGIEGLIPDPHYAGGGCHELRPGGFLKVHADFNWHKQMRLDRRINLLIYLNKNWQPEYGGNLELWDTTMSHKVAEYAPLFNRCVIFSTTDKSFHGNPVPVSCPPDRSRRSLAFYYYTNGRPAGEVSQSHGTLFKNRPGEATVSEVTVSLAHRLVPPIVLDAWHNLKKR
jgi:Rps23 Pro-64 3,4-dihydroxylase Tpa1-like proline 4-hydroxylase